MDVFDYFYVKKRKKKSLTDTRSYACVQNREGTKFDGKKDRGKVKKNMRIKRGEETNRGRLENR